MIDRLITITILAALIAWCMLAVHYYWLMQPTDRRAVRGKAPSSDEIVDSAALCCSYPDLGRKTLAAGLFPQARNWVTGAR